MLFVLPNEGLRTLLLCMNENLQELLLLAHLLGVSIVSSDLGIIDGKIESFAAFVNDAVNASFFNLLLGLIIHFDNLNLGSNHFDDFVSILARRLEVLKLSW